MKKIPLILEDEENWRYCLYKSPDGKLYCDFSYSPQRFIDVSMLIKLTDEEQEQIEKDRIFLINLADKIRNNYKEYLIRAQIRDAFLLIDKNKLLDLFSTSMGNSERKFIEYAESNGIENWTSVLDEFKLIQSLIYDYINKITEPNTLLSGTEIENISIKYCSENYTWMNEIGMKAINNWLVWMCWHEGILK